MFLYTKKYTEFESDIQNNDSLYKIHPKHQNTFELLKTFVNFIENANDILFYI